MNSKKIGTQFEQEFCEYLAKHGWWAHFLTPNATGAQPFDIIAMRKGEVFAIDCKTCSTDRFSLSRIEDNQHSAFKSIVWKSANVKCGFAILYNEEIYYIPYDEVLVFIRYKKKSIPLGEEYRNRASSCFE